MGCIKYSILGALVNVYPVERSSTFHNIVHVQDPRSFLIQRAEDIFAARKLPFGIVLPRDSIYQELEESLRARGYSLVKTWNLMCYREGLGEPNHEVVVEEIDSSRLSEWFAISNMVSEFGRQEMISTALTNPSVRLLLGTLEGKPVGEGLLFLKDRVASIHCIATLPEFRRRHVASTIVIEILKRLKSERVDLIWLRTRRGGTGEKVYSRIGFNSFTDILTFTSTPHLEDM
ncbi:MAG: GNAT family N-acetyltransferase [Candidatus Bathyarchaeia archaeon]|jgi:ribosomal protein S18 acetylase RimI-like enzyme